MGIKKIQATVPELPWKKGQKAEEKDLSWVHKEEGQASTTGSTPVSSAEISGSSAPPTADPATDTTSTPLKIEPFGNRLLVEQLKEKNTSKSGLYIPNSALATLPCAEVIAIGPEAEPRIQALADKLVFFTKYSGSKVVWEGREMLFLSPDEVLGWAEVPEDMIYANTND